MFVAAAALAADLLFRDPCKYLLHECRGRRLNETAVLVALQPSSRQAPQTGAEPFSCVRCLYCDALALRARSSFVEIVARDDPGPWL